jgi:hypothetical protein
VDDVIFIQESAVVASAKVCWDLLLDLCGWKMNSEREMFPAQVFCVIGVSVDLRPVPGGDPYITVTKRRLESLITLIKSILAQKLFGSGDAPSLAGRLGFTLSATFGRVGRCRIGPILKRAYSNAKPLGKQLVYCLLWWIKFLYEYSPRPIPTALASLPVVVSYSDGEGRKAGIGAALWHPLRPRPLAVYAEVP